MGLPLDLLNSLLIPVRNLCHHHYAVSTCCPEGETPLTKRFAEHDNTLNSMLHATQMNYLSGHNKHHVSSYSGNGLISPLNNTSYEGCWPDALWVYQGVFETTPGEGRILYFICLCQTDRLLLEAVQLHTHSGWNRRHTAGRAHAYWARLAVCQGFMKAACVGRREEVEYLVHGLSICVCVPVVQLIYITVFICGQSVASCSANCSQRLCHRHFSRHDVPNEKPQYRFQTSCEKSIFSYVFIHLLMPLGSGVLFLWQTR